MKRVINNKKNVSNFLMSQKKQIELDFNVNIDYLELRNKKNLRYSKITNNSKLFIAYYLNNVRLIDNI